jgi:hypothetical protein
MLKLSLNLLGKALSGGLEPLTSEWQIAHMGTSGVNSCEAWQLKQALCPGNRGVAELSDVRMWQAVQGSDA